jgi:SAM-dependent methyltransferase
MSISPDITQVSAPAPGPAYVTCDAGAALVLAPRLGDTVDLDMAVCVRGLARDLWDRSTSGATPDQLTDWVVGEYGIDRSRADSDVQKFLADLDGRGLGSKVWSNSPRASTSMSERECGLSDPPTTELAPAAVIELARTVLNSGDRVSFCARGLSMRPQIPDGSILEVAPCTMSSVWIGDIALYSAGENRLVAHRVVGRKSDRLLARGDSADRLDLVRPEDYLGVVVARVESLHGVRRRVQLDTVGRRVTGLLTGFLNRLWCFGTRCLVVAPLRHSLIARKITRWILTRMSRVFRSAERRFARSRHQIDIGRSALMTPAEKDADRSGLYQSKAVQQFTGLDENLDAGLTLIEEVLLNRHQQSPGKALVLGCGPGRECAALARRGFDVTGLDREPGMLEMARALVMREGVEARFVVGEADGFDLPGEVFSTVFVFSGLYNMLLTRSRRVDLLRSGYRHLEPGGRLLVTFLSDYVPPNSTPPVEKGSVWSSINPSHQEGDLYLINEAVHIFPHPDRFEAEAREAGFKIDSLFRDQRAYDRATRQVRGYAVLVRP